MRPRVTTVIPAYNAVVHLRAAIESVLSQSTPSNVIVVNDGSTDETHSILRGYGDTILTIDQPNKGLSAARNAGIDAATTEFIALLDADDVWLPKKLQSQIATFDKQPELVLVHSRTQGWYEENDSREEFVDVDQSLYEERCFARLFNQNAICVSSAIFRRETVLELGKFDEQIRRPTTQDHDLWLRIAHQHQIGFVDELGVLYRRHENNASHDVIGMLEDRAYVLEKAISYGRDTLSRELGKQGIWKGLAHTCYLAGYQHFHRGNFAESKMWLRKAYRLGRRNIRSFCGSILPTPLLRLIHQRVA